MRAFDDGTCWDGSDEFYQDSIPDMLEHEGYNTWPYLYDQKFANTLSWIASLPEIKANGR